MATAKGGAIKPQETSLNKTNPIMAQLKSMVANPQTKKHFEEMLGKNSGAFLGSIVTLANSNPALGSCRPASIMGCAVKAASLGFSLDPALGECYAVPYKDVATFQIGYKGLINLFQRSGKAKGIRMFPVYEGEIREWNKFTETFVPGERISNSVVGYYAAFELVNGFTKAEYWDKQAVIDHALKFNPMCKAAGKLVGVWATSTDEMACKTVLKHILSVYAPKSIEMQNALVADGKAFDTQKESAEELDTIDIDFDDEQGEVVANG